jgi:WD40 repeat protein
VISASSDGTVRIWDFSQAVPTGPPLVDPAGAVYAITISPDGLQAISGSVDGSTLTEHAPATTPETWIV